METLLDMLEDRFRTFADRTLLHDRGRDHSYAAVSILADRLARFLHAEGVQAGDRVGLLLANSVEYVAAWLASLRLGAIVVPLNPETTSRELGQTLGRCAPTAVVCTGRTIEALAGGEGCLEALKAVVVVGPEAVGSAGSVGGAKTVAWEAAVATGAALPYPERKAAGLPTSPAQIIFTSGTTGRPKGVVLSSENIRSNTLAIVASLKLTCEDAVFATLPFFYSYGASLLLTHAAAGGRLVLSNDFVFWNRALDLMAAQGATGFSGVPSSYAILLSRSDFGKRSFPTLRYLTCAGGALAPAHLRALNEAHPQAEVFLMYGQTEAAARLSILSPADLPAKAGSIGKGLPGVELQVVDDSGRPVPPGGSGEIVARGPNVMLGYWNDPEATAEAVRDGWLHTGDLARVDEEGFIYVVGRRSDLMKCGSYRIHPLEIEEAVLEVAGVAEAAVAPEPDPVQGQSPVAFVVRARDGAGLTEKAVLAACQQKLPRWKLPKRVVFVDAFPKTATGKIQRGRLLAECIPAAASRAA